MTDAATPQEKRGLLKALAPFPKPFWVINSVEFLERGAYYGMLSVLSVFLTFTLGFSAEQVGLLLAIQFPLLYFIPLVSAALADKLGFRKLLVVSFAFLVAGYLALAVAQGYAQVLAGVVLYGIGAGLFKPMPAATVAHTTDEERRNFGFSIYYWAINAGAFAIPLLLALVFGADYRPYFLLAAGLSVVNLLVCLFVWRNVVPAKPEVRLLASVKGLAELFRSPAFLVLLIIYSGFWFMYAITTSFMAVHMVQQGILPESFAPMIVILNAGTIILLGPVLGKLTEKAPSLPLMTFGIAVYIAGFVLIGFTAMAALFIAGIVIFSVGEFLTHPGYLSYVTKIAPKDRVVVFLSYGFIPVGIGQFLGTLAGGYVYGATARDLGRPEMFWAIISSVGLFTIAALLVYNRILARRAAPAEAPVARRRGRGIAGAGLVALALLMIPALVGAATLVPVRGGLGEGAGVEPLAAGDLQTLQLPDVEGETREGETTAQVVPLPASATGQATFVLTWTDEAGGPAQQNAPDAFVLRVHVPGGEPVESDEVSNPQGGEGRIEVVLEGVRPGDYHVEIELVRAGDVAVGGILPVGQQQDGGNAWVLSVSHQAAGAA